MNPDGLVSSGAPLTRRIDAAFRQSGALQYLIRNCPQLSSDRHRIIGRVVSSCLKRQLKGKLPVRLYALAHQA